RTAAGPWHVRDQEDGVMPRTGRVRWVATVPVWQDRATAPPRTPEVLRMPTSAAPATVQTPTSPAASDEAHAERRVLLKLSGEAFGGGAVGLDPDVVK